MYAWLMNLFSKMAGSTATTNMKKQTAGGNISGENWIGPDGVETGPGVPEDWYLTYDGPAPIVEGIPYYKNYAVDRGNGVVPIDFYIQKWGFPEGFGATDYEKETAANLTNFSGD